MRALDKLIIPQRASVYWMGLEISGVKEAQPYLEEMDQPLVLQSAPAKCLALNRRVHLSFLVVQNIAHLTQQVGVLNFCENINRVQPPLTQDEQAKEIKKFSVSAHYPLNTFAAV